MSWAAVNWANQQKLVLPSTTLVLLQLANWADEDGFVRSVEAVRIADRSSQSERSVYRNLDRLTKLGLLKREADGRRGDGSARISGKLHLDVTVREAATDCQIGSEGGPTDTGVSERVPLVSVGPTNERARPESKPEDSPPTPPSRSDELWKLFQDRYPIDSTMDLARARLEFDRLGAEERESAARMAAVYAGDLKKRGSTQPLSPSRWLREKRFVEVKAQSAQRKPPGVFVIEGTAAWKAWNAYRRGRGQVSLQTLRYRFDDDPELAGKSGWFLPTLWPPPAGENAA